MTTAIITASTLGAIGAVHVYWAAGGNLGKNAAIPQLHGRQVLRPGPALTMIVALLLFGLAVLALWRDGEIALPLPFMIAQVCAPLAALVFLARAIGESNYLGWTKRVRGTRFARLDDVFYAPLCLMLAICFGVLSFS